MKKIFALMLALALLLTLAACTPGNTTEPSGSNPTENPVQPSDNPSTPTNGATDPTDATNPTEPVAVRITEEDVRNHPVTPASDFAYEVYEHQEYGLDENLNWAITTVSYVRITGYTGADEIVVIPAEIDGLAVKDIASYSFAFDCAVKGIMLPSTITSLSYSTFVNNQFEIVVWDSAKYIGMEVFLGCSNMHTLVLGDDVTEVGDMAFFGCFDLTIKVVPGSFMEQWCKDHAIAYRTE